jgi:hypothetical protein
LPNQEVPQRCRGEEVTVGLLETNIAGKIGRLGISRQALAATLDVSETFLSRGLSGVRPLSGVELLKIDSALNDLLDIAQIIAPLALPTDVTTLRLLISRYRDNGLAGLRNLDALVELRAQIADFQRI